jgi:hypothetical protein
VERLCGSLRRPDSFAHQSHIGAGFLMPRHAENHLAGVLRRTGIIFRRRIFPLDPGHQSATTV